MARTTAKKPRLIAFPKTVIPYNVCLYAAAEALGIEVVEGFWSGRWLLANVQDGDLLHVHWPSFLYYDPASRRKTYLALARFILFLFLMRRRGARIAWTAHNLYPHDGGQRKLSHRVARRIVTHYANVIFAHGPTAAQIVAREFSVPASKLRVMTHGHWIDFHARSSSAAEARVALQIPQQAYVYAFVGSCRPYKNLEHLIDTFARLQDDSILLIAGSFGTDTYRSSIERRLSGLSTARWRLQAAFIADEDVHRYVLAGDALVLPYTEILTSGSAMLGLTFGRPVVAPNAGGLRDMVNAECGVLYDPDQKDALLDAMRAVRVRRFSEGAIIEHAGTCDWRKSAQALAEALAT